MRDDTSRKSAIRRNDEEMVFMPKRPENVLECPVCWTHQRSDRNQCYYCETWFLFEDEEEQNTFVG